MAADQNQATPALGSRQRIVGVVVLVLVIFLIWQLKGYFTGGSKAPAPLPPIAARTPSPAANPINPASAANDPPAQPARMPNPGMQAPQPVASIPAPAVLTPREAELLRLQQETEAKYIAALNELQLLKIDREIAETNKAIAAAKLDMVTAQKNIVNLLEPREVTQSMYTQTLGGPPAVPVPTTGPGKTPPPPLTGVQEANYTVISVSQIQYRWNAVMGYQGSLYSVHVGDIIPADGSKVIAISKSGVVLEKEGVKKKVSMVPVI